MAKKEKPPWSKSNPRKRAGKAPKHLSPAKKAAAKTRAKRAGRTYPNLVDNMRMAAKSKKTSKKAGKKKSAGRKSAKKAAGKRAARKSTPKKPAKKKKSEKKKSVRKKPAKMRRHAAASGGEKDPDGGLTAAGRKAFARKQGSHLKPGVTKRARDMSPTEMRRKGSWAVRFYGRAKLPPLTDSNGEPTRHALSAHAWGEPVPKTVAAARRIAAKGERLLARYHRLKDKS